MKLDGSGQYCYNCGEYEMFIVYPCEHLLCKNCDNGLCGGACTE